MKKWNNEQKKELKDKYEKYFLLKSFKSKLKNDAKIDSSLDEKMWAGRRSFFIDVYMDALFSIPKEIPVAYFLVDMSLISCVNLCIVSGNNSLLTYVKTLQKLIKDYIKIIKEKRKEFVDFYELCDSLEVDIKKTIYENNIDEKTMVDMFLINDIKLYDLKKIFSNEVAFEECYSEQYGFITNVYKNKINSFVSNIDESKIPYLSKETRQIIKRKV